VGALDVAGSPAIGRDAAEFLGRTSGVAIGDKIEVALADAQFLIDFTRPEGTLAHLKVAAARGTAMVIGTTGLDDAGRAAIAEAATRIPVVFAPNMSVGVNVVLELLATAARILGPGYDVEIIEAH